MNINLTKTDDINEMINKGLSQRVGAIGNGVLYDLCHKYPLHNDSDAVNAKIWLIGRTYAAAIERRKKYRNDGNDDFYEQRVIPTIMKSEIDKKMNIIQNYKSITQENSIDILETHKFVLDLFCKISGLKKRSLASKYLHFHFPNLFFIYDSRAKQALKQISKYSPRGYEDLICNKNVDKEYALFFCNALKKLNEFESEHGKITLRQFDNILIVIANKQLRKT